MNFFAHFQDLVDGYVGPFASPDECNAHAAFCEARGDGATYIGVVTEVPPGEMILTPEEDRSWDFTCP